MMRQFGAAQGARVLASVSFMVTLGLLICCGGFGRVNQGQVIAYDKTQGVITLISDSNYMEPGKPRFDVLPPTVVRVPENPREMGPAPQAGRLLSVDLTARRFTFFDPAARVVRSVPFTPIAREDGVYPDDARVQGRSFPVVNPETRTITVYVPSRLLLLAASMDRNYLALPPDTWRCGDEIRYYYKDPARALRVMNVTRTDLNKSGK